MSQKILINDSIEPEYVKPWMNKQQKHYMDMFMELARCKVDFDYWFKKYVVFKKHRQ